MKTTVSIELPDTMPNSARLVAKSAAAHRILDGVGALKMWEHDTKCWIFPRSRVDDVVAFAGQLIDVVEVAK